MQNSVVNKISICIVDDSPIYTIALVSYLKKLPNIEILFKAKTGLELIEKLKTHKPHVILLDMQMPDMDGMETLRKLRDEYPSVKFIMLTMHDEAELINSFLLNGANTYLSKTVLPKEIYEAIVTCYNSDFYMNNWVSNALVKGVKAC
jgi:DNA-binding NarL/FixJ family response regulator